jgi:hypothetical protein
MRLAERRLLKVNDEILRLRREEELAEGELGFHRHLSDDAIRDAVVSDLPVDRADARDAAKDVARLQGALEDVRERIRRLQAKRDRLLDQLQD